MSDELPIQPLPWDSALLGFGVARVAAVPLRPAAWRVVQAAARATGYRLLYVMADAADAVSAATLATAGLPRISRLVTYLADTRDLTQGSGSHVVVPTRQWTPALEALAWESGAYSRFRLDPLIPPTAFRELYGEWLRKSLRGEELAREVLCVRGQTRQELGLLTLGVQHNRADIGLLAVAPAHRGQGIGRQLLGAAARRAEAWGFEQVQVVTQLENRAACRFYTGAGFGPASQQDVYHCWLA